MHNYQHLISTAEVSLTISTVWHNALSQVEQFLYFDFLCSGVNIKSLLSHNMKQNSDNSNKTPQTKESQGRKKNKNKQTDISKPFWSKKFGSSP